ncbi:hypothetical protein M407DRAFT_33737 [Tulasnella calospora MUT 4182]|uniref:Protein kinase domain-containing protein n=1 Tax=Tulasnella calospora MUT 4182 TaxID=1051891 RepID=A0A0C3PQ12_9AGAM|nr:hypothetical protein M407DRAFT_33737 [Tulasnella calospora MUT 4182]
MADDNIVPKDQDDDIIDHSELDPAEVPWRARYEFLKSHGYLLRPRYRPGWKPSWPPSERNPEYRYEDALLPLHSKRLDAHRVSDGQPVFLKLASGSSPEIEIARILASPTLKGDPRNHCVPFLDILEDPVIPNGVILVLPLLYRIDRPAPATIQEFVPLIDQTLETLVFLHDNEIAHRDCAFDNVMMDARALYPEGWHPQAYLRTLDFKKILAPRAIREVEHVSYYLVDFGLSTYKQSLTLGLAGQEPAPELSEKVPYDPYKLDVYILGMAYKRFFESIYRDSDFECLQPLTDFMTPIDPAARPTARAAYSYFKDLISKLPDEELTKRLVSHEGETTSERIWNDIEHAIWTRWLSRWTRKRTTEPLT